MTAQDAMAVRMRLLCTGYSPIPCHGKKPPCKDWQKIEHISRQEVEMWGRAWADAINTGILTHSTPTLDCDILNEEAARAIEDLVHELYDEAGYVLTRIGRPPKRAFLFRTQEPFRKLTIMFKSRTAVDEERLEFLGAGQQVVVHGVHPQTHKPYLWFGGEPGTIAHADLPYIREAEARALIERCAEMLVAEHGYVRDGEPRKSRVNAQPGFNTTFTGPVDRDKLEAALAVIDSGPYDTWLHVGAALHHELGETGFAMFDAWSARSPKYCAEECSKKWCDAGKLTAFSAGTVFYLADQAAPGWRERVDNINSAQIADVGDLQPEPDVDVDTHLHEAPPEDPAPDDPPPKPPPIALPMLDVASWEGKEVPPREWAVYNRIARRSVTLLSGEGGVGKSILILQLLAAHVLARDWFGVMPEPGPVIYLNAEDDERELHFRLNMVRAHIGTSFAALKDLHLVPLAGEDALLGVPDRAGIIRATPLFDRLKQAAGDIRPVLIALDTAADMFGGNENDRGQVRQFIGLLRGLAITANAGVLLASHPSLSGITTDSGLSGSTGWHNSVRSRLYFKAAKVEGDKANHDLRELEVRKNNYGPSGEVIRMRWENGVFMQISAPSSLDKVAAERDAEHLFLDLLARYEKQGQPVSPHPKPSPKNYAPTVFARRDDVNGTGKAAFETAMQRLLDAGTIRIETFGPPSKHRSRLVRI